jgi:hypothetical protein
MVGDDNNAENTKARDKILDEYATAQLLTGKEWDYKTNVYTTNAKVNESIADRAMQKYGMDIKSSDAAFQTALQTTAQIMGYGDMTGAAKGKAIDLVYQLATNGLIHGKQISEGDIAGIFYSSTSALPDSKPAVTTPTATTPATPTIADATSLLDYAKKATAADAKTYLAALPQDVKDILDPEHKYSFN